MPILKLTVSNSLNLNHAELVIDDALLLPAFVGDTSTFYAVTSAVANHPHAATLSNE